MKYDEEETEYILNDDAEDNTTSNKEDVHSNDWGDTESEEEKGFDDDERD